MPEEPVLQNTIARIEKERLPQRNHSQKQGWKVILTSIGKGSRSDSGGLVSIRCPVMDSM